MPPKKLSELPPASALDGSEVVPVVQAGQTRRTTAVALAGLAGPATRRVAEFVDLGAVNPSDPVLGAVPLAKRLGPFGPRYDAGGEPADEAVGGNLYAHVTGLAPGERTVYAEVAVYGAGGSSQATKLANRLFDVPSGMLDNEGTLAEYAAGNYPLHDYVHPSVAYDAVGVAGYKYWMVASVLPAFGTDVTWEDEDLFVSNDAETWLRVRSLYEADKAYTTGALRLPPNDFASDARRNGFLPVPEPGDVVEVSTPAHNGNPAVDRVDKTVTGRPFKHDPAILIDGGYVYVYHSFHVPYDGSGNGAHRFLVCVRTSDGVAWEAVRSDGSTLPLTSAAETRKLFTKDGSGRYNYLDYAYSTGRSNPEVVRYGPGDYEMVYGLNFSGRFAGTTPYDFDFGTPLPFQGVGSGNHPGLLLDAPGDGSDGTLYLLANHGLWTSADRGETLTKADHYPAWVGGVSGIKYKSALCVGEGGRVLLAHVKRYDSLAYQAQAEGQSRQTNRAHALYLTEYASLAEFVGYATDGLDDAYLDVQVDRVNAADDSRTSRLYSYVGPASAVSGVNSPVEKVEVCDLDVSPGDDVHVFVTLTARTGASVRFGGLLIE